MSRDVGDQTSASSLPPMVRAICRPHRWAVPASPLRIPEALERNGHLCDEAVGDDAGGGLEEHVPGGVAAGDAEAAAPRGPRPQNRVPLHPVAVHREDVGPLLVEERVEIDQEQVVLDGLVAVAPVRAHHARIGVVGVQAQIEVGAVVGDVDVARFAGRGAVEGPALDERGDVGGGAPDGVIEPAVDHRGGLRPRRPDDRPPRVGRGAGTRRRLRRRLGRCRRTGGAGETERQRHQQELPQAAARRMKFRDVRGRYSR